ncbi:HtaA domain-containing protein [Streptomyces sp. NPDC088194]|uniref:HtaA domain-containing protein n=1 Tax=Streptomyces sp. NPDC088194 TaxID=3154931 RepID=UPI00344FF040
MPPRARVATLATAGAALLAAVLLPPATSAHAALKGPAAPKAPAAVKAAPAASSTRTVSGGRLDWGIKASFQSYVTGPIAQGSWSLTGGADTVGSSQFRFPSAQGSYDQATGALTAGFQGGVRFLGHRQSNGAYLLDLTISRPTVRISGHAGTLYADMRSKDKGTGKVTTTAQVPLAALALGGVSTQGVTGTQLNLGNVPATLTAQGARAFAGYYTAGTALDPVTLSVDLHRAAAATTAPAKKPTATPTSGTPAATSGSLADGAVDWGVRRTFREYVTGDLARGRTQVSGGAQDGGAVYRFGTGRGGYDAKRHTLDAHFAGTVRFLGMRAADGSYGLDLALGAVRVHLAGTKGTLYADGVPFATFTVPAVPTPKNGLLAIEDAPTTLTAQGAARFNGLYTAGTSMDPLSVSAALTASAKLPALPDIGTTPTTAAAAPAAKPTPSPAAAPPTGNAADGTSAVTVTAAALGAAVVLALAAAVLLRNRNRRRAKPAAAESAAVESAATEPAATEPAATEPAAVESAPTELAGTEPRATEPRAPEPRATEPRAPEPGLGPGPTSGPEAD